MSHQDRAKPGNTLKSERYSQRSIQEILERLDGPTFLHEVGLKDGDFVVDEDEIRSYCPICNDRSKRTFIIDRATCRGYCTNLSCQGSNMNVGGGNLLELFALAEDTGIDEAVERLAEGFSIPLIRQEATGDQAELASDNFHFVEVGHFARGAQEDGELHPAPISFAGQNAVGRGVIIPIEQLEEFTNRYKTDIYVSHFTYNTGEKTQIEGLTEQGKLHLLGDFYVVFKATSSAEIVHAINQAIDLVDRLKDNYGIPYEATSIFYANKSIEVHVDYQVFGIVPTANLHEVYRRMTCAVIGVDPLKPERSPAFSQIDLSVYRHDYLTNIPGSVVTVGDREIYKIRMSYAAFKKMSYQRLHEFSLRRPDLPPREPWTQVAPKAREFFNSVKTSMLRDTRLDERDTIASLFYRVAEKGTGISSLQQLAPTLLRRLFDESRQALATCSEHLNWALAGGLYPGHLYIVAGLPGSGCSTMVLQIMNHIAAQQDVQCLFVGLKRGIEEIFGSSLSFLGRIPLGEIDEKRQNPADLYDDKDFNRRIFAAYERYQQFASNITILEGAAASSLSRLTQLIRDKKEELASQAGRTSNVLLVVDNLQLMVAMMRALWAEQMLSGEHETAPELSQWNVQALAGRLKALARELDITVLATFEHYISHRNLASQLPETDPTYQQLLHNTQFADTAMVLSRQGASLLNLRDHFKTLLTGTPRESLVKEIGDTLLKLEQDYRQTKEFQALRSEFAVVDIIKNRSGPLEKVLFVYHKPMCYFEPLPYLDHPRTGHKSTGTSPVASAAT